VHALDLIECLSEIADNNKLIMSEIVEFDPSRDRAQLTENLVIKLIRTLYMKENNEE